MEVDDINQCGRWCRGSFRVCECLPAPVAL